MFVNLNISRVFFIPLLVFFLQGCHWNQGEKISAAHGVFPFKEAVIGQTKSENKDQKESASRAPIKNMEQRVVEEEPKNASTRKREIAREKSDQNALEPSVLPLRFDVKIPFMTQAPYADWGDPYQEACEEASLIMAQQYFFGGKDISKEEAKQALLKVVTWENGYFGRYEDTDTVQTTEMAKEYFKLNAKIVSGEGVSVKTIKSALFEGNLVIVPTAGRLLKNPHFRGDGPLYHMLVIRGWDEPQKKFIVNDPGTRYGESYRYSYSILLNAIHDWNAGNIMEGKKMMIVLNPK